MKINDEESFLEDYAVPELTEDVCEEIRKFSKALDKIGYFNIDSMAEKDSFA